MDEENEACVRSFALEDILRVSGRFKTPTRLSSYRDNAHILFFLKEEVNFEKF